MNHQETTIAIGELDSRTARAMAPAPSIEPETSPSARGAWEAAPFPVPRGVIDLTRREVRVDAGQSTPFSERELELLRYMMENAGRVITRDEILSRIWRLNPQRIITRTIDMHIVHLRAKLEDNPKKPKVLRTVRGEGYVFGGRE